MTVARTEELSERVSSQHRGINWWHLLGRLIMLLSALLSISILHRVILAVLPG